MNKKINEIAKTINSMSGAFSPDAIFSDWVLMMAMSIANTCTLHHGSVWEKREKAYLETMAKYDPEDQAMFPVLSRMLVDNLDDAYADVLGQVYMAGNMGNDRTGQVFTPDSVCRATARIVRPVPGSDGLYWIHEPACGAGAMLIAVIANVREDGGDIGKIRVWAQDLDYRAVYMCYVQLSLIGIDGVVTQGDTLANPGGPMSVEPEARFFTPGHMFGTYLFYEDGGDCRDGAGLDGADDVPGSEVSDDGAAGASQVRFDDCFC